MKILLILFVSSLICMSCTSLAGEVQISSKHPRLILSSDDISIMRQNVLSGQEPWKSTWDSLKSRLDAYCEADVKPKVYLGDEGYGFYHAATNDGYMARDLAIAYQISENKQYADAAIELIRAWVSPETLPGTYFNPEKYFPNTGMMVARGAFPFMYAYDLLCADNLVDVTLKKSFENWMLTLLPHIKEGMQRWEDNDYFGQQYYQNHIVAETLGLIAIGVLLQDESLVSYAVESQQNKKDMKKIIEGIILMDGQPPYAHEPGNWKTQDGEIMDRYRHFALYHYEETTKPNRGLQYAGLSSTLLVVAAEIGRLNGFDLYNWVAKTGENVKLPLFFYADFYITKDASVNGGFYTGESSWINNNSQSTFALWEVANARYPDTKKFIEVLQTNVRGSQELNLLGPVTLTHGRSIIE